MNINDYKIHRRHDFHYQVQTLHHFIHRVVGLLPSANHDRALSHRTVGDPIFELVNDKRNALIHQVVEIGRVTGHLRHHTNLKPKKKRHSINIIFQLHPTKKPVLYSPTTGDQYGSGSGDRGCFEGCAIGIPLGSNTGTRPDVSGTP